MLVWTERVIALFGTPGLSIDGRNEVRAVYGGFGLAIASLLFAALRAPSWAPGALLAVAIALFGMAAGRLISIAIDRKAGRFPVLFFFVEVLLGGVLILAGQGGLRRAGGDRGQDLRALRAARRVLDEGGLGLAGLRFRAPRGAAIRCRVRLIYFTFYPFSALCCR